MKNFAQLTVFIVEETKAGRAVSISEEELAEAVHAPADAKLYKEKIREAIEQLRREYNLRAEENFDKATFVFRQG